MVIRRYGYQVLLCAVAAVDILIALVVLTSRAPNQHPWAMELIGSILLLFGVGLFWRGARVGTVRGTTAGVLTIDGWFRRRTFHAGDIVNAELVRTGNAVGRAGLTLGLTTRDGRRCVWDIWWTPIGRSGHTSAPRVVDAINSWLDVQRHAGDAAANASKA